MPPYILTDDEFALLVERTLEIVDAALVRRVAALASWHSPSSSPPARAAAALPREIARAFLDAGVPLNAVAIVVQDVTKHRPLFTHAAGSPDNPASVMKLVTTFAALDLLGPRLPLEDRRVSRRHARRRRAARQSRAQRRRRSQDHGRAMAGVHGDAARKGLSSDRRRPRARPHVLRARRPRSGRVRRRAAASPTTSDRTRCSSTSSR